MTDRGRQPARQPATKFAHLRKKMEKNRLAKPTQKPIGKGSGGMDKKISGNITIRVGRETKGRRGKGVTTVSDLPLSEDKLLELAASLKQRLGTGGTIKDGRVEIQGDHRDRIVAELEGLGYRVKRAGG
jgi:predicted translation initiation factor SUI1